MTGADLHESKGVAAAPADTVFIADGAGSGAFAKLPAAAISGLANPFGAQLFHVTEEQAQGTGSATSRTTVTWIPVALNTVRTNEIAGASLSSSQITLPTGTYFIDATVPYLTLVHNNSAIFKARWRNVTSATDLLYSLGVRLSSVSGSVSDANVQGEVNLRGRFTLSGTSVLNLEHIKSAFEVPVPFGNGPEMYANVLIWKTA